MKKIAKLSTALVAALAAASTIAWSEPGNGANTEWEFSSFYADNHLFIPCLGETVHFFGEVPYSRHTVTSPSGKKSYHFRLLPVTPNSPPFTAVGEFSGKVYHYQNGLPLSESFNLAAGEVLNVQMRECYVADDGARLISNTHIHFTTTANGELVVERSIFEFACAD